jgi:hypothetical protein
MLRSTPKPPLQTEFLSLLPLTRSSCRGASRPRMLQAPSVDVVPHREASGMLEQPATIRCKPSRRPQMLPQAPSNDVVPRRTGDRINASRRSPLQVDETKARRRPLATSKQAVTSAVRGQPPARPSHDRVDSWSDRDSGWRHRSRSRSQETTPPGRAQRQGRRRCSSKKNRVFTQRPRCGGGVAPNMAPPTERATTEDAAAIGLSPGATDSNANDRRGQPATPPHTPQP